MWIRDFFGRLLGAFVGILSALVSPLAGLFGGLCDGLGGSRTESRTAEAFGLALTLGALAGFSASALLLAESWESWTLALLVSGTTVVGHLGWGGRWLPLVRSEALGQVELRAAEGWAFRKACIGAVVGLVTAPIFAFRSALAGGPELLMTPVDSVLAGKEAGIRAWKGESKLSDEGFQQQAFCSATGRALSQSISLVGNRNSSNVSQLENVSELVAL